MKRLEHIRTLLNKTSRFGAKTPHGAMMVLAQIAQEKQRLEQERGNWERRIRKIDNRLGKIAATEQQLLTIAKLNISGGSSQEAEEESTVDLLGGLPPGFSEVTVKY